MATKDNQKKNDDARGYSAGVALRQVSRDIIEITLDAREFRSGIKVEPNSVAVQASRKKIILWPSNNGHHVEYPESKQGEVRIRVRSASRSLKRLAARFEDGAEFKGWPEQGRFALRQKKMSTTQKRKLIQGSVLVVAGLVAFAAGVQILRNTSNNQDRPGKVASQESAGQEMLQKNAHLEEHKAQSKKQIKQLVLGASHGKAHLAKVFRKQDDVTGIVIQGTSGSRSSAIAWVVGNNDMLIIGQAFNEKGENLTWQAAKAQGVAYRMRSQTGSHHTHSRQDSDNRVSRATSLRSKSLSEEQFFNAVKQASGIMYPAGGHLLYVMYDANCIFCHKLFGVIQAHKAKLKSYNVGVKWIPVAILKQSSLGKGAAALEQGKKGLVFGQGDFDEINEIGGLKPSDTKSYVRQVARNTRIMLLDGHATATPTLLWRNADGRHVTIGKPSKKELMRVVRSIGEKVEPDISS